MFALSSSSTGNLRVGTNLRAPSTEIQFFTLRVCIASEQVSHARGFRVRVWFGFVRAALLPAVGTCVVLGQAGDAWPELLSPCNTCVMCYTEKATI